MAIIIKELVIRGKVDKDLPPNKLAEETLADFVENLREEIIEECIERLREEQLVKSME